MNTDINAAAQQAAMQGNMSSQAAREASVMLSANTGPYQKEMGSAAKATEKLADTLHQVDLAIKRTLKSMGHGMIGLGGSMQAMAAGATASAASFEEAFARVAKTTGLENRLGNMRGTVADMAAAFGQGDNELQQFENDIRALSTAIPVGTSELSHLADVAGQLGVESENLTHFADTAAKLGAGISDLSSDVAIAGLANLSGALGVAEGDVHKLGSSLAELANHTRGSANEMLLFSDRLGGIAVQAGMTADEVLALGAAVSAVGQRPQLGASAIQQTITRISEALQTGGDEAERFAQVMGTSLEELRQTWASSGATPILMRLLESLSNQGDEAVVTLNRLKLSGTGVGQVLGALAGQMDVVRDAMGKSNTAFEDGVAVGELAAVRFDTLQQKMKQFRQATSEVFRSMGQGTLTALKPLVDMMTRVVNVFNDLPQPLKTAMGMIAAIGGAAMTALGAFTLFFAAFHAFFLLAKILPGVLRAVGNGLKMLGGDAAVAGTRFLALGRALASVGNMLAPLRAAIVAFGTAMKSTWTTMALGTRAMVGIRLGMVKMAGGVRAVTKAIAVETWHHWVHALRLTTKAVGTLAKGIGAAALAVGKMLAPYMALMAAMVAAPRIWGAMKTEVDDVTVSLEAAAEAAGLVLEKFEDLKKMELGEKGSLSLAREAEDLLSILDRLDQEEGRTHLQAYGFQLLRSGNDPEQVREHIEHLARLADIPIRFQFTLEDITTGEDFATTLENADTLVQRVRQGIERTAGERMFGYGGILGRTPRSTVEHQEEFKQQLNELAAASQNDAAAVANFLEVASDLDRQFQDNEISLHEYNNQLDMLEEKLGKVAGPSEELRQAFDVSAATRRRTSDMDRAALERAGIDPDARGFDEANLSSARSTLIRLMESDPVDKLGRDMQNVISDTIDHSKDLYEAIDSLNEVELNEIISEIQGLAIEANITDVQSTLDDQLTELGRRMEMATLMQLDPDEAKRYWDTLTDAFPKEVGLAEAIQQAHTELDAMAEENKWSEEADRLRKMINQWGEEFRDIRVEDLVGQLQAAEATDQIRILLDELSRLEEMGIPEPIRLEIKTQAQQQIFQSEASAFRQEMSRYDQLIQRREDVEQAHTERLVDMEEDRSKAIADQRENHQERLEDLQANHEERLEDLRKNHNDRMKDIAEQEKEAIQDRIDTMADAFKASENLEADHAQSAARLVANMARQNRAMSEAREGMNRLRNMGVTDEAIEALGLNDPRNANQIQRVVQNVVANPELINRINRQWAKRLDLSEAFVQDEGISEVTERFDEMRKDAKESYQEAQKDARESLAEAREDAEENLRESIAGIRERYRESVADAREAHAKQISDIGDELEELGRTTADSIEELIDRAMDSGIDGLRDWAVEVQQLRRWITTGILPEEEFKEEWQKFLDSDPLKPDTNEAGDSFIKDWWTSFKDGATTVWDNLKDEMEDGGGQGMFAIEQVFGTGVGNALRVLKGLADQDDIWNPTISEAFKGAGDTRDTVVDQLEKGTGKIADVMGKWATAIEDNLNPVLEAVGADPLEINVPGGSSSRREHRTRNMPLEAADGALLPRDARIQSPGTLVQWAEPETGGEAFIPLANSKRARSREIWKKTGELLGINIDNLDPHSLHSFADGGINVPDMSEMGTIGAATERAMEFVFKKIMGSQDASLGQAAGPSEAIQGGWKQMWQVLSQAFPNAQLHSGFRPGAITATGNRSYHGMGRAIDVTPSTDIAEWIRRHFMEQTKEMIYSPMNQRQIHNGRDHYYDTPITRAQHWDHVHWAMAGGGQLTDKMKKGTDSIPAWLANGEFVMQAEAVKEYGLEAMEALNARQFAQGGLVGRTPAPRGREPVGPTQGDMVGALVKALESSGAREEHNTHYGPIEVKAQDAKDLIRQLDTRRRRDRLTAMGRERD